MSFIQTIAYTTKRPEEMRALMDAFERDDPDSPGLVSVRVLKDRDRDNSFLVVAEFETYEAGMENSARPEVDAFAKGMAELVDGPPSFANYDVLEHTNPGEA